MGYAMTARISAGERSIAASSLLFEGLGDEGLESAFELLKARRRHFPKGSFLQRIGEPVSHFGIVLTGELECSFHNEGFGQVGMSRFTVGETYGVTLACAGVDESPMQVVALSDADVLLLDCSTLASSSKEPLVARLALNMVRVLARQNLHLNRKVRILGQSSMRDRLAVYLAECETDDQGFAIVPYSQTDLARFLGVNRSALSREIGRMRDEGVLVTDGMRMRLVNRR